MPAAPAEGDHVAAGPGAPTALAGTVERAAPRTLSLRIDEPGPGTALVAVEGQDGQAAISVWSWLYGADAPDRAPALLEAWQNLARRPVPSGGLSRGERVLDRVAREESRERDAQRRPHG